MEKNLETLADGFIDMLFLSKKGKYIMSSAIMGVVSYYFYSGFRNPEVYQNLKDLIDCVGRTTML